MGEEVKSAREIAMAKVAKLGELTEEERLKFKYAPEGEKLAARYISQDLNLINELGQYEENARSYVAGGAVGVFLRNIGLPANDNARRNNKRAMEGLKTAKSDKVAVEGVFSRIGRLFEHYAGEGEQQKQQAYESLKADFTARMQAAVQQQLGVGMGVDVDVTKQPQFQEEWRRAQAQMDAQYSQLLDEYKQELAVIS